MQIRRTMLLLIVLCPLTACRESATEEEVTAFVGVHLVSGSSPSLLRDQTVLVRGQKIVGIGPQSDTPVPSSALRIDGSGKYLMPGLAEMHGHIPSPDEPVEYVENVLFLYLANGITTVRGMLGFPGQLEWRDRANRAEILSPSLYLAGPSFSGRSIQSPEEAVERVLAQKSQGWDLLKIHPGLTRAEYDAMAEAAREQQIPFAGHIPEEVGLLRALEMGQQTIDHLDGYIEYLGGFDAPVPDDQLAEVARLTREAGAWVVPTMALWETILGASNLEELKAYAELQYMPKRVVESWERAFTNRVSDAGFRPDSARTAAANRKRLLKALSDGGVRILLGTDAPQQFSVPGFSLYREIPIMVEAGMSSFEIIASGTINVGEYFRDKDDFGTVEVGKRADLVLLKADPLQDAANISQQAGVMVRGRWLSESEIRARLDQIAESYR